MSNFHSIGLGVGTHNAKGEWLEIFYAKPVLNPADDLVKAIADVVGYKGGNQAINITIEQATTLQQALANAGADEQSAIATSFKNSQQPLVVTIIEKDQSPATTPEAYLKLQLISHRLVKPHGVDLSGIFPLLPNVAWTNKGAIDLGELPQRQLDARLSGELIHVYSIDKFPQLTNYVAPTGCRIADASRVRLGAHVAEGTTVMHEGFINFNAGTLGESMIEGRISAGVTIGKGSDLGGSSSTMGTLSGGGNIVISVGENSLLGANAGVGIPVGDRCIVESGLYITAGTKIAVLDGDGNEVEVVKGRDLAGKSDLVFRRNSLTGKVEAVTNKTAIQLNEELHSHN